MSANRVFELRTYVANPGKFEALQARFRDHTCGLFRRHGIELIGFWTPADAGREHTLIYLLAFPSRQAADAAWSAFRADPEWVRVREESEREGRLTAEITSIYLNPTDYSPLK